MAVISVTLDTSHDSMGPCAPLEQSPFGESFLRHASTALLSSVLDRGKNPFVVNDAFVCTCVHMRACVCMCLCVGGGGGGGELCC